MESYVRREGRWTARAKGTVTPIMSLLLILSLHSAALAQPNAGNEPVAAAQPEPFVRPKAAAEPEQPVEIRINELNQRRAELVQRARQDQLQWMNLGRGNSPQHEQLAAELRSIREQVCRIERELIGLDEQRRKGLEDQIARELAGQGEKPREEVGDPQRQIEKLGAQNRRQAGEIASALEQTRREIRVMEERLTAYGITYQRQTEPSIVNPLVPPARGPNIEPPGQPTALTPGPGSAELNEVIQNLREDVRQFRAELQAACERQQVASEDRTPNMEPPGQPPAPTPGPGSAELNEVIQNLREDVRQFRAELQATCERQQAASEDRTPNMEPPGQPTAPAPGPGSAELNEVIQNLREDVRQFRAELRAACERQQAALDGQKLPPPQPESPVVDAAWEQLQVKLDAVERQLHVRLDAIERQLQQRPASMAPPEHSGWRNSPYSVGSAGPGWYPNLGW